MPEKVAAYAAHDKEVNLKPYTIERRDPNPDDVVIDIDYCGICHSDLHFIKDDWGMTEFPVVPGHEIIGTVKDVGSDVKNFKPGDTVGVGCMVDSCGKCEACGEDLEQHCLDGFTMTYGSEMQDGTFTYGGYSKKIVTKEHFVLRVPDNLDKAGAAPLLCAGITTYSPLKQHGIKEGMTVGVIGLGGLGHMGVKLASAMGAKVVMITTSEEKGKDAKELGADDVLMSNDEDAMEEWKGKFDFLLNTIPVGHDINPYLELLKYNSTMVLVGSVAPLEAANGALMIFGRKAVAGSLIGGIKETQEMLDFCGEHNITSTIEKIDIKNINDSIEKMEDGKVKYRFVIDMESLESVAA